MTRRKATKKPKKDFAQNALASVLRLTGTKSLTEAKVVPFNPAKK